MVTAKGYYFGEFRDLAAESVIASAVQISACAEGVDRPTWNDNSPNVFDLTRSILRLKLTWPMRKASKPTNIFRFHKSKEIVYDGGQARAVICLFYIMLGLNTSFHLRGQGGQKLEQVQMDRWNSGRVCWATRV